MYYTDFDTIPAYRYSILYADPPWSYGDKMHGHTFSLEHQYATLSVKDLKALPIGELCRKDAALFMWVTNPQLPIGLEVMRAWGFRFKTVAFVWQKLTHLGNNVANLGRWTMGSTELCLLGTMGHPQRVARNVHQLVTTVRGRHSEKPDEVRQRIEQLMGGDDDTNGHAAGVGRIELFARGESEGWDQWGNTPIY